MFFPRLRRHAKWMFVFLALVFGIGFVGFGVGAGGTGIGDILRGGGTSGVPSASDARKRTERNPKDAQAWRDLATALQTDGKTADAITALNRYVALRPREPDALRELAGLYLASGTEKQRAVQVVQLQAAYADPGASFPGTLFSNGQPILTDRISQSLSTQSSARLSEAATAANIAFGQAVGTYQQLVRLQPNDPNVQLELASTAQQAGNLQVAIDAYRRFLALAPFDANAAIVKQQLKRLQAAQGPVSSSPATPSG